MELQQVVSGRESKVGFMADPRQEAEFEVLAERVASIAGPFCEVVRDPLHRGLAAVIPFARDRSVSASTLTHA